MSELFGDQQTPTLGSTGPMSASEPASGGNGDRGTTDAAKEQVKGVAQEGVQGGKHVASVAAGQAKEVVSQAGSQAQTLLAEAKSELLEQAASQKDRVAKQLHALASELGSMASSSEQDGLATDLAKQASRQVGTVAHWVSEREPGSLVGELKDFARAKPGMFLVVAAGIGLAAGRMTRGVKAGAPQGESSPAPAAEPGFVAAGSPVGTAQISSTTTGGYAEPLAPGLPVGVGGSYTEVPGEVAAEEPFIPRTPGLAP